MALDLPVNPDQRLLHNSLQRFLADNPRPGWQELSDGLAIGGVTIPEVAGGFGGGVSEAALVVGELGPALAGADWLSHAVASWLLGQLAPDHGVLPDLVAGERRAAIVCSASVETMPTLGEDHLPRGVATLAAGGAEADLVVLATEQAIFLIAADHVERSPRMMLDGSLAADLGFTGDADLLAAGSSARVLTRTAIDMMLAARCAEAVGLMQRMIADSTVFLAQRHQFGRAIGSFQALRHRMADMQLASMKAAALTETAVRAVETGRSERAQIVGAACVQVTDAVRIVGEGAVQIHGAMGLTEELSLGAYFKRALAIGAGLGPQIDSLARFTAAAA